MKHFLYLKDIPASDLKKILIDAKKRKSKRKKLSTLETDKDNPLKGKLLVPSMEQRTGQHQVISFILKTS